MSNPIRKWFYGKQGLFRLFRKMYTVSIGGMNYGNVDLRENGEMWMLARVKDETKLSGRTSPIILDVGANIGQYARAVREVFGTTAVIHSFEPSPSAQAQFLKALGQQPGITLHTFGLGASDSDDLTLHAFAEGGTGSSIFKKELPDSPFQYSKTEKIRIRTLDGFLKENNITQVDLLKIDVEGYELEVLKGASIALASGVFDRIQFEFGEGSVGARVFFRDFYELLSPAYEIHHLLRNGLVPVGKYSLTLENFNTTNYVALKRG